MSSIDQPIDSPPEKAVPQEDEVRVEGLLAHARLLLAVVAVVTLYFDSGQPTFGAATDLLPAIYAVSAAALSVGVRRFPDRILRWGVGVHALDVAAAAFFITFTEGPGSPASLFLAFVLLGAALRWGFQPTLLTGAATVAWYLIDQLLLVPAATDQMTRSLPRAAYLFTATFVIALVAGSEAALHRENRLVSLVLARLKSRNGFTDPLQEIFGLCLAHMGADSGLLALEHEKTGRLYLWNARRSAKSKETHLSLAELRATDRDIVFFEMPREAVVWGASRRSGSAHIRGLGTKSYVELVDVNPAPHIRLLDRQGAKRYVAVRARRADWSVRLIVFNPARSIDGHLRLMRCLSTQVGPALHSQYLMARLPARIVDIERARMARELHDGLIQSLIGLEMEIDALRRRVGSPAVQTELRSIREHLHGSILDTRDLMTELRPHKIGRDCLLAEVGALIERFRHDTGIDARLSSDVEVVDAAPGTSTEIVRIVQEALVNVRKHAGATHVVVRFSRGNRGWTLSIDDNGCGFAFAGRLSQEQLDAQRRGPIVIKERVRTIGGELSIQSEPGRGASLVVSWPFGRRNGPAETHSEWPAEKFRRSSV
jgi:signal transduction histidine kinase